MLRIPTSAALFGLQITARRAKAARVADAAAVATPAPQSGAGGEKPGWVLGWMIGDVAGHIVVSKPFVVLVIWYGLGMLGSWLGEANLGRAYAPYAAVLLPATLLVWTLWHPARSHAKMWCSTGSMSGRGSASSSC